MKRVLALVTGASGFCGRHLCQSLIQKGFQVVGTYGPGEKAAPREKWKWAELDVTRQESVARLIRTIRPREVYHLAAQSSPRNSIENPGNTLNVNTLGTIYLLEALWRFVPKSRLLFVSTSQVYGRSFAGPGLAADNSLISPETPYAMSKALAEFSCAHFAASQQYHVVIARPTNHVGAGQAPQFVFSDWCRQIAEAEAGLRAPVLEVGNVSVERDFLNVRDVVAGYELLIQKGKPGIAYNIASGHRIRLRKYLEFLCQKSRVAMKVQIRTNRVRAHESKQMLCTSARIRRLGWKPRATVFDGIKELLEEWREKVRRT